VRCAKQQADAFLTNKTCVEAVTKCASHSTCGRPNKVACCLTTAAGPKCRVKKDAAHCSAKGTVGTCTSCCDACPAPGNGPTCFTTTTTTILPVLCVESGYPACGGACPSFSVCVPQDTTALPGGSKYCACVSPLAPCTGACLFTQDRWCPPGTQQPCVVTQTACGCGASPSGGFLD
jgi:hypothetical protein